MEKSFAVIYHIGLWNEQRRNNETSCEVLTVLTPGWSLAEFNWMVVFLPTMINIATDDKTLSPYYQLFNHLILMNIFALFSVLQSWTFHTIY